MCPTAGVSIAVVGMPWGARERTDSSTQIPLTSRLAGNPPNTALRLIDHQPNITPARSYPALIRFERTEQTRPPL